MGRKGMSKTMIHPETGAILRRRKRIETVTYQDQSRTVEVEGWFPDDDGDGVLVGADSKPLDDALAEMRKP
jgi:HTH-type transcriptional regulator/antitoxin MqsA